MTGPTLIPLDKKTDVVSCAERMSLPGSPFVGLDGSAEFPEDSWGPLGSLQARVIRPTDGPGRFSAELARRIASRRASGGPGGTGIGVVLAYDRESGGAGRHGDLAVEVDAALVGTAEGPFLACRRGSVGPEQRGRWIELLATLHEGVSPQPESPFNAGPPVAARTSLPREAFLRSVDAIRAHLRDGDIYQANLTQRFEAPLRQAVEHLWCRIRRDTPSPRGAFVRGAGVSLVSASPETFVDVSPDGVACTIPIKGTRPRSSDASLDRAAATDLQTSEKDRAELLMIVDLERNDLGRVSRTGTVSVSEMLSLRSYATVHHLVAAVSSRLRDDVGTEDWIEAMFPGGSVTGAPKRRAMEVLRGVETVPRGWYTGSLLWFDDNGWTRSSILIRSVVVANGRARIGAGSGIIYDSDPQAEWEEANHKARPLARALGFEPEEAS